jgi:hypothetical protein
LGEDGNAGNYDKSKKYGVSATVRTAVMKNEYSEFFFYLFQKTTMNKMCIQNKAEVFFYLNVTANLSSGGTDFLILVS